jgi:hypothetical protein
VLSEAIAHRVAVDSSVNRWPEVRVQRDGGSLTSLTRVTNSEIEDGLAVELDHHFGGDEPVLRRPVGERVNDLPLAFDLPQPVRGGLV